MVRYFVFRNEWRRFGKCVERVCCVRCGLCGDFLLVYYNVIRLEL